MAPWLPPEVLLRIVSYVHDISTLLSLRLVNRIWSEIASSELDHWACVSLNRHSMNEFEHKFKDKQLRQRMTDVAVILPDRDYWHTWNEVGEAATEDPTFGCYQRLHWIMMKKIHRLPHLTRLSIHIRPPPRENAPNPTCSPEEKETILAENMRAVIESLRLVANKKVVDRTLRELSIQCLPLQQGYPELNVGSWWSDGPYLLEKAVRKLGLTTLKLGLVGAHVWQSRNPGTYEVHNHDPPGMWVAGACLTLRHLSITCWGFYMKNITGRIHGCGWLPELRTLELRGCGFTSDLQLDWLLRQKKLYSITLDDCAIVYKLILGDRNPIKEPCNSVDMIIEKGSAVQEYQMRWSYYFNRLQTLPALRQFNFGSSRVRQPGEEGPTFKSESREGPAFKQPSRKFLFGLFPDRYLHMADASPACQWVLRSPKEKVKPPAWLSTCHRTDRVALRNLLESINQRVEENAVSDHAGYVESLVGNVKQKQKQKPNEAPRVETKRISKWPKVARRAGTS